jgi:hypothetical protein
MKKLGLIILGAIIGALVMYYFCCENVGSMDSITPTTEPKGLITPKEAMVLDQAYNIKHRIINDSLYKKSTDGGDNRSSWWSVEDMQNFIDHAENQAGELGYTMNGLRIYLGAYPNSATDTGLTTMFIVPTGCINNGQGGLIPNMQCGNGDIKGADGLNMGGEGIPPGANYPQ